MMGESYKADINLTVGSPSVLLQYYLQQLGMSFSVFDPFTRPNFNYIDEKAVFFIATNHQFFREVIFPNDSIVIDPWGDVCDRAKQDSSVEVITLGR